MTRPGPADARNLPNNGQILHRLPTVTSKQLLQSTLQTQFSFLNIIPQRPLKSQKVAFLAILEQEFG
jgi:hypothetical protein